MPYDYLGSQKDIISGFNLNQFVTSDFADDQIKFFSDQAGNYKLLGIELATKVANLTFLGMQALQDVAKQNGWHRSNGAKKHNYRDHDSTILVTTMRTINQLINSDQELLLLMQARTPALLDQIRTIDSPSFLTELALCKDELHKFGLAGKLNNYVRLGVIRAAFELWKDVVVLRQAKERYANQEEAHRKMLEPLKNGGSSSPTAE